MKSPLVAPEKQIAEETSAKMEKPAAAVIDTSKMAKGQREALELAEAARDPLEDRGSFASNLFVGRYDFDRIYPYPAQSAEDRAAGEEFLRKLESYLRENIDFSLDEENRRGLELYFAHAARLGLIPQAKPLEWAAAKAVAVNL